MEYSNSAGRGVLRANVWPAYVGALDCYGVEPGDDYQRGQISWRVEDGEVIGRGAILVPKGIYPELAYFHHPTQGLMCGHQHLEHPFNFQIPGVIKVERITAEDFTQLPTPRGYRMPVARTQCR
jgi:hypothetical protein